MLISYFGSYQTQIHNSELRSNFENLDPLNIKNSLYISKFKLCFGKQIKNEIFDNHELNSNKSDFGQRSKIK